MYHFRLERTDGSPADPPTLPVLDAHWWPGDMILLTHQADACACSASVTNDADQPPALVVEDRPGSATSGRGV